MNKLKELISYGFFGAITTGINLALFALLKELGVYYLLANTIAYFVAVVINYVFNVKFVFPDSAGSGMKAQIKQFLKFLGVRIFSLIVDNALFFLLVSILYFPVYPSRIGLSFFIILATYFVNKFSVFKSNP